MLSSTAGGAGAGADVPDGAVAALVTRAALPAFGSANVPPYNATANAINTITIGAAFRKRMRVKDRYDRTCLGAV